MVYLSKLQIQSAERLRPPKKLKGSEWALEHAWFSTEDSVNKERYTSTQFPFQPAVLDAMTDPYIEKVVVEFAAQMGKTVMQRIAQGYFMKEDPAPMLMIQPSLTMAETYSKDRLAPFLRDCPKLTDLVKDPRSRDSGNTVLHKQFPGGHLTMAGANSPASLASRPIRVLFLDEVDRYPLSAGIEGDPIELGIARTRRFWNRKIIITSTPTISGLSRIHYEFEMSNKQYFYVPCPECLFEQVLIFKKLEWQPSKPNTVKYVCDNCGHHISNKEKASMIRAGKYKATQDSKVAGFHCSELYVIGTPWAEIVEAFLKAKDRRELLQVFVNTRLAETFDDYGDAPDFLHLYARRENYSRGSIPLEVLFLTAAVDVQEDRFECEVKGWGKDYQSWSIDHYIFMGDTSQQEVYKNLDAVLERNYVHPNGALLKIKGLGIDSGDNTQSVYFWVRRQETGRVFALKGETIPHPIGLPKAVDIDYGGKKISNGLKLWGIGVSLLKSELYKRLRLEPNDDGTFPGGYLHFPEGYPEEYFAQLTAEAARVREVKGRKVITWEKTRSRNEALDLSVYNRAVAIILGIDRLTAEQWQTLEEDSRRIVDVNTPAVRKSRQRRIVKRDFGY